MDGRESKEAPQLERRMKDFKRTLLLTATVPPTLVVLGTVSSYACLLPLLAHVLLLFFFYRLLLVNAFIIYDYFTPRRIEEIAKRTTQKELNSLLGPRDLGRGIFLIKILWQYDSRSSGYLISLFLTILFLPSFIIDLALPLTSPLFLVISGFVVAAVWFTFSRLYTETPEYRPSEDDVLLEEIIPTLNYRRRWARRFNGRESPQMLAIKIHTRLDDELKMYESGEKERPVSLDEIINRKIPPPYKVR